MHYVHIGCHVTAPEEWINFDSSPTLRFERIPVLGKLYSKNEFRFPENVRFGDVTTGLPLADNSCAGAYASHVLEHLSLQEFHAALDETFRLLAPGGVFRAVVPDLETYARDYISTLETNPAEASMQFMRRSLPRS